jgi:transcriptional regulator with XRE-family HTH domain
MVTRIRKHARGHLYVDEWLEAKGLSYQMVADRLDTSRTTVWRWAKEQHRLDPGKMAALARAMGMERAEDFFRRPPPKPDRPSIDKLLENAPDDDFMDVLKHATKLRHRAS